MLEPSPIPPHITVCYFMADKPDIAIKLIDEKYKTFCTGGIVWPAFGAFSTSVVYIAPILNEYLLRICTEFNALLDDKVKLIDYYRPFSWMPHTTLATKLTTEQFYKAFFAVSSKFTPMTGTATALSLVVCERCEELKTWQLPDSQAAVN